MVRHRARLPVHVAERFSLILNYKHDRFRSRRRSRSTRARRTVALRLSSARPPHVQRQSRQRRHQRTRIRETPITRRVRSGRDASGNRSTFPNPATGTFDSFGQFTQPGSSTWVCQLHYDVRPRVSANMTVANLVNACFGGSSTPWSLQIRPATRFADTRRTSFYISNFYNGTSPNDTESQRRAAQPVLQHRRSIRRTATITRITTRCR